MHPLVIDRFRPRSQTGKFSAILPARTLDSLPPQHPCAKCGVRDKAVCGVLACDTLAEFKSSGCTQRLQTGEPLFHEGDSAGQVFNLTEGALKLYRLLPDGRRQVTGFLLPGDFLGITQADEQAFTAEALLPSRLCSFSRGRFAEFAAAHPELERELYRLAAHELAAAHEQIVLLGRKSALERLASFLLDLERRCRPDPGAATGEIDLPMSRSDIADYLGLTKETVSRVLAELKGRRLVRLVRINRVALLDRPALARLAEGIAAG